MRHKRKDGHDVYFKFHEPQPDLLNAATHEQRWANFDAHLTPHPQTVTISTELSDAYVALLRAVDYFHTGHSITGGITAVAMRKLLDAREQVLHAGGDTK